MNDLDALIIGGGVSGLATAWWLARRDLSVAVWEQSRRPGGKIRTDRADGYTTERSAALIMNFRPEVNRLLAATGLDAVKVLREPCANRYLVQDGRLVPLPMTLGAMMASPLWSRRAQLRLALEPFIPRSRRRHETVAEFIARRLGREVLDKAMEPYVAGPLASDPELADARAVLPRLTALEERYGSIGVGVLVHKLLRRRTACGTEAFSFVDGMSTLVDSLASTAGVCFQGETVVTGLERHQGGWRVTSKRGGSERTLHARQVVLSVPAHAAAPLLKPLDPELACLLEGIEYTPLAMVHLGLERSSIRHPLDGTGFLAPRRERASRVLNGNLWVSSLFPGRAPKGKALLTSYLGGARRPDAAQWDDERSVSAVLSVLEPLLGLNGAPEMVRIERHGRGLPLYHGNYHGRMQAMDNCLQRLPGLYLAANYRDGISVRDRIACGHAVAESLCSAIGHRSAREPMASNEGGLGVVVSG